MGSEIRAILKDLSIRLKAIYNERLDRLVLYGSQARGDAQSQSDIDVLVVLHGEVDPGTEISRTAKDVAAVSLDHDVVVCCLFISTEQYKNEQSPLLLNIRREGVLV